MLVEFSVGNFKSFKDIITFSMVAAKITAQNKELDQNNIFSVGDDLKLLKTAAIYGANASGKSNLAAATLFMRQFVLNSSKETQAKEAIPVEAFRLSEDTRGKPSFFQMVFLIDGIQYRYGFEVDTRRVVSEWLFHVPTTKEANLFERTEDGIVVKPRFKEGRGIEGRTRNNALFLSVVAQFNGKIAQQILEWFLFFNVISGLSDEGYRPFTIESFEDDKDDILRLIKGLDLSIEDIQIELVDATTNPVLEETPRYLQNEPSQSQTFGAIKQVRTIHRTYDANGKPLSFETFDINRHESQGTRKLFALAGPLVHTLKNGMVLFVDELDARLHPLITCAIIDLFHSKETNPHNAQLVFATHDTNLLSNRIYRRDQIWFVEKDAQGATRLYSLVEFRVRNDASFEKDYIHGKYGAIPFLGDFSPLFDEAGAP